MPRDFFLGEISSPRDLFLCQNSLPRQLWLDEKCTLGSPPPLKKYFFSFMKISKCPVIYGVGKRHRTSVPGPFLDLCKLDEFLKFGIFPHRTLAGLQIHFVFLSIAKNKVRHFENILWRQSFNIYLLFPVAHPPFLPCSFGGTFRRSLLNLFLVHVGSVCIGGRAWV